MKNRFEGTPRREPEQNKPVLSSEEKFESVQNSELREVSAKQLVEIIDSPVYKERLTEAWNGSIKSGFEVGFGVVQHIATGEIRIGKNVSSSESGSINRILSRSINENWEKEHMEMIKLHTHPKASIWPSAPDFGSLFKAREMLQREHELDYYPLEIIVASPIGSMHEQVDVLLLQERKKQGYRTRKHGGMMYDWLGNSLDDREHYNHQLIAETINKSPFVKAQLISYERDTKTGKLVPKFNNKKLEEKLGEFAHKITRLEKKI